MYAAHPPDGRQCKDMPMPWHRSNDPSDFCHRALAWTDCWHDRQWSLVNWCGPPLWRFLWTQRSRHGRSCSSYDDSDIWPLQDAQNENEYLWYYLRIWSDILPKESNEAAPVPGPIIVDKSPPLSNGFSGPPTRDGSTPDFSLLNVRHSEPTSMTRSPTTRPHSEHIISPAR